jgi:hypothetical protein
MVLPVKKIYINSNFKTADSQSDSDFKFQLARTFSFPKNTVFYIENFTCSHAWWTVEQGFNDNLCMHVNNGDYRIVLTPGNYTGDTFAVALQTACNIILANVFTVSYHNNQNNIKITALGTTTFRMLTDSEALATFGLTNTINNILQNSRGTSATYSSTRPYVSGFLELISVKNIYLHSPNLSSFTTYGCKSESNVIKKVAVSSDYGYMIIDNYTSTHDWMDCSSLTISCLEFQLRDSHGNLVPLHGSNVSFSIVFSQITLEDN